MSKAGFGKLKKRCQPGLLGPFVSRLREHCLHSDRNAFRRKAAELTKSAQLCKRIDTPIPDTNGSGADFAQSDKKI